MVQDKEKKPADQADQEFWEQEESEDNTDQNESPKESESPPPEGEAATETAGTTAEWFVDFDVWEAALEAKFGSEFEQVLTGELGSDWINNLNTRMMSEQNFYKVLDDIKENISDKSSTETLGELVSIEDTMGFEALGQGEVIYDEKMVGPGGIGGGGGGGRQKGLPNLSDVRKKDFEAAGELKSPKESKLDREMINEEVTAPDEEVVLMDRNDFSRMNYFARKELDRHKDDLDTRKVLERESKAPERQSIGMVNRLILVVAMLILLYAIFCLFALPVGEYQEDKLAAAFPADYLFQPSTTMHKQGELSRAGGGGVAICIFFLQPSLNRLELDHMLGGDRRRFNLDSYNGKELRIDDGPWGDTLEVSRLYSQNWPTNRSAFLSEPYLILSRNGQVVLQAIERRGSGMLPGLLAMDIVTGDGKNVGVGYASDNLFNLSLNEPVGQGSVAETEITKQLLFLFSLLEL
jgi:hypothetical protein